MTSPLSVYVHIPFCKKRCTYCDFVTYAGMEKWIDRYMQAVEQEISQVFHHLPEQTHIHTIFFGGGTPSMIATMHLNKIIRELAQLSVFDEEMEISLEANPGTLDLTGLISLKSAGFNRISLGVQSVHDNELAMLGRIHNFLQAGDAFHMARSAGFENINLDFIYGLPDQRLASWKDTLKTAVRLHPEHLSLYSLTVEPDTVLEDQIKMGLLPEPDPDVAADMLEYACEYLDKEGYIHYEVSNWAIDRAHEAKHNLQYWRNEEYLGFGAGAHGYINKLRVANIDSIEGYITHMNTPGGNTGVVSSACVTEDQVTLPESMMDEMMLRLRLLDEGVHPSDFMEKFGVALDTVFSAKLEKLVDLGLVQYIGGDNPRYILTQRGMMLGNQVFMEFVAD